MPTATLPNAQDKASIKKAIPSGSNKIITATVARLYVAYPSPSSWTYANLSGAVVFVRDTARDTFFFKMVDLHGNRGIIWEQELYHDFQYHQDRTFFHSFACDDYYAGFSFADESEASTLYKKVMNREKSKKSKMSMPSVSATSNGTSKKKKKGGIDKSMIGAPSNFEHIGHIGWSAEGGFDSRNIDPSWTSLFDQLGSLGISQKDIQENADFIQKYVKQHGGIDKKPEAPEAKKVPPAPPASKSRRPPPPPPPSRGPSKSSAVAPPPTSPAPPTLPERGTGVHPIPPPPPTRPTHTPNTSVSSTGSGGHHPPPPPPRSQVASKAPPPVPSRGNVPPPPPLRSAVASSVPPPPPPPPPISNSGGVPPPPPPPPPAGGSVSSPPPPPPPPVNMPAAPAGRDNLLASIRGAGGITALKKADPSAHPAAATAVAAEEEEDAGGGGGDLAAALAAALNQRKTKVGDSDEEDDDDEWD